MCVPFELYIGRLEVRHKDEVGEPKWKAQMERIIFNKLFMSDEPAALPPHYLT